MASARSRVQRTPQLRPRTRRRTDRVSADLANANRAVKRIVQLPAYAVELFKKHRYKVIWGGRGGARSWSVARALLLKAAEKKLRILCAREMQSSLRDSVHQLLRDQIDLMGVPGFRVTDREIRHANGSLFLFEGLRHNATKIKSLEGVDICWVEEAERISKDSWGILIPTIRKEGSEIWVTFNPDKEDDATYKRFILNSPKDCWQKKVNSEDNPWLSLELREERDYAYATDPESADHIWGGNIRHVSEAQILRGKFVVEEFTVPLDKNGEPLWSGPYQGQDFGFATDPAAAIRAWVNDDVLYVEYEMWKLHLEIDDTPAQVMEDIPQFEEYWTRADSSRPDSISYEKRHGLPLVKPCVKHPGSVEDGIAHLRSYRRIVVHPRCKHFQDECKHYSYKVDLRSGDVLPIVVDKHNHLMDSLRYALEPLIKPRRRAGFLFANGNGLKAPLCPTCESLLPDDGECPHCGYSIRDVDVVPSNALVRMPDGRVVESDETGIADLDMLTQLGGVVVPDTPMVTTRTNGHTNGNGHSSPPKRRISMRGLNG